MAYQHIWYSLAAEIPETIVGVLFNVMITALKSCGTFSLNNWLFQCYISTILATALVLIYQYPGTNLGVMNDYSALNTEHDMFIVLDFNTVENVYK
jgi:hypothetical protein